MQTRITTLLEVLIQAHKAYKGMEDARMVGWNNKASTFQNVIENHMHNGTNLSDDIDGLKYDGALFSVGTKSRNIIDILLQVLKVKQMPEENIAKATEEINRLQAAFPLSSSESLLSMTSWTKPQYLTDYAEFVALAKDLNTQTMRLRIVSATDTANSAVAVYRDQAKAAERDRFTLQTQLIEAEGKKARLALDLSVAKDQIAQTNRENETLGMGTALITSLMASASQSSARLMNTAATQPLLSASMRSYGGQSSEEFLVKKIDGTQTVHFRVPPPKLVPHRRLTHARAQDELHDLEIESSSFLRNRI